MVVGAGVALAALDFEIFSKNVVLLVLSGKTQISQLLPPLEKFGNKPSAPPGKIRPTRMAGECCHSKL